MGISILNNSDKNVLKFKSLFYFQGTEVSHMPSSLVHAGQRRQFDGCG